MTFSPPDLELERKEFADVELRLGVDFQRENNSHLHIDIKYVSLDTSLVKVNPYISRHVIIADMAIFNTTFVVTSGRELGEVGINVTVHSSLGFPGYGENLTEVMSTVYNVTISGPSEIPLNYALIYVTLIIILISIFFTGLEINLRGLHNALTNTPWLVFGICMYALIRPLVTYIIVELSRFRPAHAVGVMTTVCAPPSLMVLPLVSMMKGDVCLAAVLLLICDFMALGVLPLWTLTFPHIISPSDVPYGIFILLLVLTLGALGLGLLLRTVKPLIATSLSKATPVLAWLMMIFALAANIVNLHDVLHLVPPGAAAWGVVEPILIIMVGFAVAISMDTDISFIKTMAAFLLLKGQSVAYIMLVEGLDLPREVKRAVSASAYLCFMSLCVTIIIRMFYKLGVHAPVDHPQLGHLGAEIFLTGLDQAMSDIIKVDIY